MKPKTFAFLLVGMSVLSVNTLAGCASTSAPEFKGRWQAVNRYAAATEEIPLYQAYMFYPSPMDGTLKNMLGRWAQDTKMTLSYLSASDFTLHAPVARIRTGNLQEAVSQLNTIYAGQRISIVIENNQIVVRHAGRQAAETAPGQSAAQSNSTE